MKNDPPAAPKPPDPNKVASAQMGANIGTAIGQSTIGNPNTYGPNGSTVYDVSGYETITGPQGETYQVPRYNQTTTLSPEQQHLYDQQNQIGSGFNDIALNQTRNISDTLSKPVDASALPHAGGDININGLPQRGGLIDANGLPAMGDLGNENYMDARNRTEQAMYDRINPQLDRDREALETKLVNQGFQRGTQAFTDAMDQYGRQVTDTRLGITAAGLNEQQGQFGMGLQRAGFNQSQRQQALDERLRLAGYSDAQRAAALQEQLSVGGYDQSRRQQALQETLALRNQPINEISALRTGGQVSLPGAQAYNAPQIGATPVGDYTYNSAALKNQQYGQQLNAYSAELGGLYGLGGAALGAGARAYASDRRLKTDIVDLGIKLVNGIKLYAYKYLWAPVEHIGVMADEVMQVRPEAVAVNANGYLMVDYRAL